MSYIPFLKSDHATSPFDRKVTILWDEIEYKITGVKRLPDEQERWKFYTVHEVSCGDANFICKIRR
jgi:hypothetical protein